MLADSISTTQVLAGDRIILECSHPKCRLPFGYIQNGALVIFSKHYGDRHVNAISLATLEQWLIDISRNGSD